MQYNKENYSKAKQINMPERAKGDNDWGDYNN